MPQPKLSDLMSRFLENQATAQAAGLGMAAGGEVVPHEASPLQPIDPQTAWSAAIAAGSFIEPASSCQVPSQWSQLVAVHEPEVALPFCFGNFPQLLRSFHTILHKAKLSELRPKSARPIALPGLVDWAKQTAASGRKCDALIAAGCLRLAHEFDEAETLLRQLESGVSDEWRPAIENEQAALDWHRGQAKDALVLWLSQPVSVPTLFNRGMAALFLDRPGDAIEPLNRAIAQLPETSPWHHLGRLYVVLAEDRK